MYTNPNNENLWDFEVFDDVNFMNCNRIHPLKQHEVQMLAASCKKDPHIVELIVFGSAKEFRCNSFSDIDLVIVRDDGKCMAPDEFATTKSELDILFSIGERLKKILWEEGVTVYRRDN